MNRPRKFFPDKSNIVLTEPRYDAEVSGSEQALEPTVANLKSTGFARSLAGLADDDAITDVADPCTHTRAGEAYFNEETGKMVKARKAAPTGKVWDPCVGGCRIAQNIDVGAYLVAQSGNSKIALHKEDCATTYASQETCPRTCPFLGSGCYGEGGMVMMAALSCNESCKDELTCAKEEADAIADLAQIVADRPGTMRDSKKGRLPLLRLHTVGDCRSTAAARLIGDACEYYTWVHAMSPRIELTKGERPVWGYTHSWRVIPYEAWGDGISMVASCNHIDEVRDAYERGYKMVSLVTGAEGPKDHPHPKLKDGKTKPFPIEHDGLKIRLMPCKAQVDPKGASSCSSNCRWCLMARSPQLFGGVDVVCIVLAVHGAKGTVIESAEEVVIDTGV
jgi:hypothetical protein